MEKVTSNIENLENEAEKSLEDARAKAAQILTKATEESQSVLSSGLEMDEIKKDCETIINNAHKESEEKVLSSKTEAETLKATAAKKVDTIVQRLTGLITEA